MSDLSRAELETLYDEIRRYLEAVDTFRSQGCEPCWRHAAALPAGAR